MSASTNSSVALEVCVDSVAGVAAALHGGADRVELCANLLEGGTTPSHGTVEAAADALRGTACKLFVIIRPRGGDFVYSRSELDVMRRDVAHAAALGAHGVVFGCLTAESAIDAAATTELLELSRRHGLDATFHRAFDMTLDPAAALDALVAAGVPRVLTSGCAPSAVQGAATIKALVAQSAGRIVVMAGGGVNEANVAQLVQATGVREVHSSARQAVHSSCEVAHRRPGMTMCSAQPPSDWTWHCASAERVTQLRKALLHTFFC